MNRGIALHEMGRYSLAVVDCRRAAAHVSRAGGWGDAGSRAKARVSADHRGNILPISANPTRHCTTSAKLSPFCESFIQTDVRNRPTSCTRAIMKAATLNDTARNEEAVREADAAVNVLQRLVDAGSKRTGTATGARLARPEPGVSSSANSGAGRSTIATMPSLVHSTVQRGCDDLTGRLAARVATGPKRVTQLVRFRTLSPTAPRGSICCTAPHCKANPRLASATCEVDRGGQVFANRVSG